MDPTTTRAVDRPERPDRLDGTGNPLLPLRLVEIATDVLMQQGRLTVIDRKWVDVHVILHAPKHHDEPSA